MDLTDYIGAGLIGCQQKSKEEIFNDYTVWADQKIVADQTKYAFLSALNLWYVASTIGNAQMINSCQPSWDMAYYTEFWDLVLDYQKKSDIFWNSLSGLTGDGTQYTGTTNFTFCRPTPYQQGNMLSFTGCSPYTIDFTGKLSITEDIHNDYITSLRLVMLGVKNLLSAIDNDTFNDFNPSSVKMNGFEEYYLYNRKR